MLSVSIRTSMRPMEAAAMSTFSWMSSPKMVFTTPEQEMGEDMGRR